MFPLGAAAHFVGCSVQSSIGKGCLDAKKSDTMTMIRNRFAAPLVAMLSAVGTTAPSFAVDEKLAARKTRPDVEQLFLLVEPDVPPVASVILFPGGAGKIKLWQKDPSKYGGDFLVRSRRMFAEHGFLTAVVDVPSDRRRGPGLREFRGTSAHRTDIGAIVELLRRRADVPVWLIGASRGTVSAAHLAASLPVDGVVLTAAVTEEARRWRATVFDAPLDRITKPVLIVHHRDDECRATPYYNIASLKRRFTASAMVEHLVFEGGDPPQSKPCRARSAHGFFGIERRVVDAIAAWIKRARPE